MSGVHNSCPSTNILPRSTALALFCVGFHASLEKPGASHNLFFFAGIGELIPKMGFITLLRCMRMCLSLVLLEKMLGIIVIP